MAGIRGCTWRLPQPILPISNRVQYPLTLSLIHIPSDIFYSGTSIFIRQFNLLTYLVCIQRSHGFRCCSTTPNGKNRETQTPQLLKVTVSFVTELLRLFSPAGRERTVLAGHFTSAIYAEDCIFEDPTIKFQGKELYARNLSLLVPFFDDPSIQLKMIEKGPDTETECIIASWKLRTYLKLPWRPLISIDGRTIYDLDEGFRIVKHVERWNISALEAVIQIFTTSSQMPDQ